MSFLPLVFGWPPFLFPVHVVFLEFVIDPACSIVFEAEDPGAEVMRRPPRDPRERLFGWRHLLISLTLGLSGLAAVCAAYGVAAASGLIDGGLRAFGFATVVFTNLALIHATRSRDLSLARSLRRPNAALWWVTGLALAALLAAVYWPPMAVIFRFEPLSAVALAWSAAAGAAGVLWYEAYKLFRPVRRA
jgi:Ca2+-transporting ATPase